MSRRVSSAYRCSEGDRLERSASLFVLRACAAGAGATAATAARRRRRGRRGGTRDATGARESRESAGDRSGRARRRAAAGAARGEARARARASGDREGEAEREASIARRGVGMRAGWSGERATTRARVGRCYARTNETPSCAERSPRSRPSGVLMDAREVHFPSDDGADGPDCCEDAVFDVATGDGKRFLFFSRSHTPRAGPTHTHARHTPSIPSGCSKPFAVRARGCSKPLRRAPSHCDGRPRARGFAALSRAGKRE